MLNVFRDGPLFGDYMNDPDSYMVKYFEPDDRLGGDSLFNL